MTYKITLPDSPHPIIISKNPGFRALYLARRMNSIFRLINTFFLFLIAGFCPKNFAFDRKIMALPESVGLQLPHPPLARTPMRLHTIEPKI